MLVTMTEYQKTLTSDWRKSLVWNALMKFAATDVHCGGVKMSYLWKA